MKQSRSNIVRSTGLMRFKTHIRRGVNNKVNKPSLGFDPEVYNALIDIMEDGEFLNFYIIPVNAYSEEIIRKLREKIGREPIENL